jgi:hypothetical protein
MRRRIPLILLSVPIIEAITAAILFACQGGFGGGHGDLDFAIGVLLLPSVFFIMALPIPENTPDIFIILLPALLNTILWGGIALVVRALLRRRVAM